MKSKGTGRFTRKHPSIFIPFLFPPVHMTPRIKTDQQSRRPAITFSSACSNPIHPSTVQNTALLYHKYNQPITPPRSSTPDTEIMRETTLRMTGQGQPHGATTVYPRPRTRRVRRNAGKRDNDLGRCAENSSFLCSGKLLCGFFSPSIVFWVSGNDLWSCAWVVRR